jgi:hypothetical protein
MQWQIKRLLSIFRIRGDFMCRKVKFTTLNLWLAVGLGFALLPSLVEAQAPQPSVYDVSGRWELRQGNTILVTMDLHQNGIQITGEASYPTPHGIERGSVKGTFGRYAAKKWPDPNTDDLNVEISWHNAIGVYWGRIRDDKRLSGNTYPKQDPSKGTDWHSEKPIPRR